MSLQSEFRADLHCHSTFSDGTLSPSEIVHLAKKIGLSGLSITDHDSILAYPQALEEAKEQKISMIPGVEFSAMHKDISVHILGYAFDLHHDSIARLCEKHKERRQERNSIILEKLAKKGLNILESELKSLHVIGRPHIAQAMVQKGYAASINDAFKKFLGDNKSCYAKGQPIEIEETLDAIHQAKGIAVLAHPHLAKDQAFVKELLQFPFDGLECYYAKFPNQEQKRWVQLAMKKNLLITGGSDFHGDVKPAIPLGCSWVNEELFQILAKHYDLHRTNS